MSDPTIFESRLATALVRYADLAPVEVNAGALAGDIASRRPARRGRTFAGLRLTPLLIGLLLLAAAAAAVVGSRLLLPRHIDGVFEQTGPMTEPRSAHVAVVLNDGRVLIAGGGLGCCGAPDNPLLSAELFDPDRGTFHATGSLLHPAKAGVLLDDGRVLIVAGIYDGLTAGWPTSHVQLYDPSTERFSDVDADPAVFRNDPMLAVRFGDGDILILEDNYAVGGGWPENAIVFHPASLSLEPTTTASPISSPRDALLLPDGRVLVAGCTQPCHPLMAIYDPGSGGFELRATPTFDVSRLALLPDGRVLALGQFDPRDASGKTDPRAAIFDPRSGTFTEINAPDGLASGTATLPDGRVFILYAAGQGSDGLPTLPSSQLYDPATGTYEALPAPLARQGATVTLLPDGRVLLAGGVDKVSGDDTDASEVLR